MLVTEQNIEFIRSFYDPSYFNPRVGDNIPEPHQGWDVLKEQMALWWALQTGCMFTQTVSIDEFRKLYPAS